MFTLAGSYSCKSGACRDGPRSISTDLIEVYKKVYKIIHGFPSVSFDTFFQFSYNFNTSKHSLKLHKRRDRTDLRQHSSLQNELSILTIRYDTIRYFNVRSKADISQLNLPHGTDN